jgi:alpha-ketoglutarate-dependent taurine dioxygenase
MHHLNLTTSPRTWTASTIDSSTQWYVPLPAEALDEFSESIDAFNSQRGNITDLRPTAPQVAACRECVQQVQAALESGRGFAIVDRVPTHRYSPEEATIIYWLIGMMLGEPFEQNVHGSLLYDVRDTGESVAHGARFSVTSYESSFHTDNSFGRELMDYVGLLCLHTARSGGVSQVVSGHTVLKELLEREPASVAILCEKFHMDRRGGVLEGEQPTIEFPVVEQRDNEIQWRYLRFWIESGHAKAGVPLEIDQVRALDSLDALLGRVELRVEFALQPGQIYFINNRWILHNRTAFQDDPEPNLRRHLVRLWLRRRDK